jgi:hypothetical protein
LFSSCSAQNGFDADTASVSALQACDLTRTPLTSTTPLPGGGIAYNYDLPDGQVISYPQTPPGFDAKTATAAEDQAYGVPQAPPAGDPAAATYAQEINNWTLAPGGSQFIVGSSYQSTLDKSWRKQVRSKARSPRLTYESGPYWGGYVTSASAWTRAAAEYYEPKLGNTGCSNPAVTFWSGIGGYGSSSLGQDGTASGVPGFPLHGAWFEVLPGGMYPYANPDPTASAGTFVEAVTDYPQNDEYQLTVTIGSTPYVVDESGGYDGSDADIIAERPEETTSSSSSASGGNHVPLLNFQSIVMRGLLGQGQSQLSSSATALPMSGFASLGGVSGGQFTETDQKCSG